MNQSTSRSLILISAMILAVLASAAPASANPFGSYAARRAPTRSLAPVLVASPVQARRGQPAPLVVRSTESPYQRQNSGRDKNNKPAPVAQNNTLVRTAAPVVQPAPPAKKAEVRIAQLPATEAVVINGHRGVVLNQPTDKTAVLSFKRGRLLF